MDTVDIAIPIEEARLPGDLIVPEGARALVVFAHGSGSSRRSSRNRQVAARLQEAGFATLLFDLLTETEERAEQATGHLRFDIDLLAGRLLSALAWSRTQSATQDLKVGLFGASTGAAAALVAAAKPDGKVAAVVSRGGRPDLAGASNLHRVEAPTLFVVGGEDHTVLELNRQALEALSCERRLEIVAGATHLFEEPGALEEVADLASAWFGEHL